MSAWFTKFQHSSNAEIRLFCFPYAGGSSSIFAGWKNQFANNVDIFAIQTPGRAERFKDPPISSLNEIVDKLFQNIQPYLDKPSIFIGHSNGSLIAYELARRLQKSGMPCPGHIVISAKRAPHLPPNGEHRHDMPYDQLVEELAKYSNTPPEILYDKSVLSLFLPMLRADFAVGELHEFVRKPRLHVNASLFWGMKDEIEKEDIVAWKELISGAVDVVAFEEGHFFIHDEERQFVDIVKRIVYSRTKKNS